MIAVADGAAAKFANSITRTPVSGAVTEISWSCWNS